MLASLSNYWGGGTGPLAHLLKKPIMLYVVYSLQLFKTKFSLSSLLENKTLTRHLKDIFQSKTLTV